MLTARHVGSITARGEPAAPEDAPLAIARRLVALGLSVIPIPRPRPGVPAGAPGDGKVPALPWREYQARRPTDAELVAWFSGEPQNVAIVTGAVSDLVMIDLDSPEAIAWGTSKLRYTPWQVQTRRGYHLAYRHPGSRVPNRARLETPEGRLAHDAGIPLKSHERQLLTRLSAYVTWAGRYPVPMRLKDVVDKESSTEDLPQITAFVDRLEQAYQGRHGCSGPPIPSLTRERPKAKFARKAAKRR